jgi:hypothetical protein
VATGANQFFVLEKSKAAELGVDKWCEPVISSAREIIESEGVIRDGKDVRVLLNVPPNLDRCSYVRLDEYLSNGEDRTLQGGPVARRYLCRNRTPWWSVRPPRPAPIVATYMARQAPTFALNPYGLRFTNVVHGIYPKRPMSQAELKRLVHQLNADRSRFSGLGRTYQGGLEKFEPREMEDLPLPE